MELKKINGEFRMRIFPVTILFECDLFVVIIRSVRTYYMELVASSTLRSYCLYNLGTGKDTYTFFSAFASRGCHKG